jgi:hypothetical protein
VEIIEALLRGSAELRLEVMNDAAIEFDPIDDQLPVYEVSDDALEAAFATRAGGATTLLNAGSYCFTCRPQDFADGWSAQAKF